MRAWASALAVAGIVVGLAAAGPANAQPPKPGLAPLPADQFRFSACNKSKIELFVAFLYKVSENSWRYVGWANYKPGQCATLNIAFPKDAFFWYAENGPGTITYAGKDAEGCVNQDGSFDRTVSGDYTCEPGEKIVGFHKITEEQIRTGVTLLD